MKLIKNWKELSQVPPNDKYKIVVDLDMGSGWVRPVKETKETEEKYFEHHLYLSTHTFYGKSYKYYSRKLQEFGFNIMLDTWDKGE